MWETMTRVLAGWSDPYQHNLSETLTDHTVVHTWTGVIVGAVSCILFMQFVAGPARRKAIAERTSRLAKARTEYDAALEALRGRPTDPAAREHALSAGRRHFALLRAGGEPGGAVTVYDETALKNDLDAAVAGAGGPGVASGTSVATRLKALEDLHAQGLVSADELKAKREKILAEV